MEYPFVLKLSRILKSKKTIFQQLKEFLVPIEDIIEDPAVARDDKHQNIILRHYSFFHEDTGFLPLISRLMQLNDELVHYIDDEDKTSIKTRISGKDYVDVRKNLAQCGEPISNAYLSMMSVVAREQYFLGKAIKPTLEEISRREDYKEHWKDNLSHFKDLLKWIEADLDFAKILVGQLNAKGFLDFVKAPENKRIIANNIVMSIKANDFEHAKYWVRYGRWRQWVTIREDDFLNKLVLACEQKNSYQVIYCIGDEIAKNIFNDAEIDFFWDFINTISMKLVMRLIPRGNIIPNTAIELISVYHVLMDDVIKIGKDEKCNIVLADSISDKRDVQCMVFFVPRLNRFGIVKSDKQSVIKKGREGMPPEIIVPEIFSHGEQLTAQTFDSIDNGDLIEINGYEFRIEQEATDKPVMPYHEYRETVKGRTYRISSDEAQRIAAALIDRERELDILRREAEAAGAKDILDALEIGRARVEGAVEDVAVSVPEVGKVSEIRRRKKTTFRRLRQRLRVSRKLTWISARKNAVSTLEQADRLIKSAQARLRARKARIIQGKFAEEKKKLEALAKKLERHLQSEEGRTIMSDTNN